VSCLFTGVLRYLNSLAVDPFDEMLTAAIRASSVLTTAQHVFPMGRPQFQQGRPSHRQASITLHYIPIPPRASARSSIARLYPQFLFRDRPRVLISQTSNFSRPQLS